MVDNKVNLRSVDLNLLASFDALMIEGNLTRAADRIGLSQPAMSAALQRLRLTFHDELFVRTRQGMIPTPRAIDVYSPIREALTLISSTLIPNEEFDPARAERSYSVVADNYFESVALGPLMARLQQSGSGLSLATYGLASDSISRLLRMEVDLIVDYVRPESDLVQAQIIGSEKLLVIARKSHPRLSVSATPTLSMAQYLAEEHVFLPLRSRERSQLEFALGGREFPRKRAAQVQNFTSMLPVVAATDYLAVIPARLFHLYEKAFAIRWFHFPADIEPIPLWMLWAKSLQNDASHRWFRETVQSVANDIIQPANVKGK
ncbi:HTH-type transcriptional regulator LeuO [Zhongshania aliphaticivorans]|uniref:HTH-type transcriptional regulator LeuO n=2 Tax=Zhongshania aliphaticivorans TaxID=1470434 RepID=A0A5S9PZQ4_9GAMM|nr:HTH-type transcriptional regulator LeuO [Zhongshania aliphaticivorans]CAA0110005.1 HTH-type transcriptional regulator LeuO [Zhongshania aliphaticivorans]